MTFDFDLTFEIMMKIAEGATMDEKLESPYLAMSKLDNNQEDVPFISLPLVEDRADLDPESADFHMGNRYWRRRVDLIEAVARDAIVFYKTLANSQKAEEFAREFSFSSRKSSLSNGKKENAHEIRFPLPFLTSNLLKRALYTKKEEVDDVHIPVEKLLKQRRDDAHYKERKRVLEKARMDNHFSLMNAAKDNLEVHKWHSGCGRGWFG